MTRRKAPFEPAPPDPGIIPGGIRDRAMRALLARGPVPADKEKTRASQEFWRAFRERQREEYRLRDLIEHLNLALDAHFVDRALAVEAADYLNELYLAITEKRT